MELMALPWYEQLAERLLYVIDTEIWILVVFGGLVFGYYYLMIASTGSSRFGRSRKFRF